MAAPDDSIDDDVFESTEDTDRRLNVSANFTTPSPTGYRNYQPPAEVLKLAQSDIIDDVEPTIHKVRKYSWNSQIFRANTYNIFLNTKLIIFTIITQLTFRKTIKVV